MGSRSGRVRQQSSEQLDFEVARTAREKIRQSCSFIAIDKCYTKTIRKVCGGELDGV